MTAAVLMSRRSYFPFGNSKIYPNLYVVFLGESASRKSTVINLVAKTVKLVGFDRFAPSETSKGKFAMHLAGIDDLTPKGIRSRKEQEAVDKLFMEMDEVATKAGAPHPRDKISESFICAGEMANFLGLNNLDFASFLGDIWDKDDYHEVSYKQAGEFKILNPLVNMLAGNTFEGMVNCLPPQMLGQGFLSRCIFVFAPEVKRENRIAFPTASSVETDPKFLDILHHLKTFKGVITLDEGAGVVLTEIYNTWKGISDHRFKSYAGRRFTQLLKLCMIECVTARRTKITMQDAIRANTWLSFTEALMPRALGEYGAGRHSMGANALLNLLYSNPGTVWQPREIWERVSSSFENAQAMQVALGNLLLARKVEQKANGYAAADLRLPEGKYIDYKLFRDWLKF